MLAQLNYKLRAEMHNLVKDYFDILFPAQRAMHVPSRSHTSSATEPGYFASRADFRCFSLARTIAMSTPN